MVSDPGDQRPGARTPPGPDGNAVLLRPLDEVRHDQEVAGEAHLDDDAELALQPLPVVLLRRGQLDRAARRFAGPRAAWWASSSASLRPSPVGKLRQDRVALLHHEGAAAGDVEGVVAGLRQVGEQRAHGLGRLEPVLGGDPPALVLADEGAVGDAQQGVVRLVHARAWRNRRRWWRPAARRAHRPRRPGPARRRPGAAGRGAAARHRSGRRTPAASRPGPPRPRRSCRRRSRGSTGPSVPPDSRISPSACSTTLAQGTTGSAMLAAFQIGQRTTVPRGSR